MQRTAHVILMLVVIMLTAMAVQAQDMPRELRRDYPEERYLIRPGIGDSPESAAEAARLEIAKYFESKITGETVVREWAQSSSSRGRVIEDRVTELSNNIMISASRDIPGIEIALTERDRDICEAWAVLEKHRHSQLLRERIDTLDSGIAQRMADATPGDLVRLKLLAQVLADLLSREQARQDLALLETDAAPPSNQELLYDIMSQLDRMIAETFDVALVFTGDIDPKVRAGILKGITDAGIRIREYPSFDDAAAVDIDLVITVEHTANPRSVTQQVNTREFTFHFVNWVLSVTTMDPGTRAVISSQVFDGESNGSFENQAFERMINNILNSQVPALTGWIYDTIFEPEG